MRETIYSQSQNLGPLGAPVSLQRKQMPADTPRSNKYREPGVPLLSIARSFVTILENLFRFLEINSGLMPVFSEEMKKVVAAQ